MQSKKILIIEDEEALASVISSKFKFKGFEVAVEYNGQDGLNKIEAWRPDLILLDIIMPKMNGYEVLENLQKKNNKIPIIIISNSGQDIELEKIKKLGAVDYIIKTQINPDEIVAKAARLLNHSIKDDSGPKDVGGSQAGEDSGGGAKVLLVEDDLFLRDICYKKLIKEGFNVSAAVDGGEAIKKINEFRPEIILLDIILPVIDGFEVLKQIRLHKDKAIKSAPVIMLTNLGQEDDIKKALKLGASDYLVKAHFTTDEIAAKVKKMLNK